MRVMRKIVSSLLALAMMLTLLPTGVFATDTAENSTNRAKLRMVYMGPVNNQNTDTPTIQNSFPDTSSWVGDPTTGTTFWVGLVLSDLKKMDDATATGHTDSSGNVTNSHFYRYTSMDDYYNQGTYMPSGIFSISVGLEYAGEYLTPLFTSDLALQNGGMSALKRIDTRYASYKLTNGSFPMVENINSGTSREQSIIKEEDDPDLVFTEIVSLDEGQTSNLFFSQDLMNDDDLVIMAIPFRLKAKPAAGTKVIQAALNAANMVIQTGSSSYGIVKLSWDTDRTNLPDQNAKAHIDYEGDWDMFAAGVESPDELIVSGTPKTQYVGSKSTVFDGITLKYGYPTNDDADVPAETEKKWYYGEAGKDTTDGLTEIASDYTWTAEDATNVTGKTLYVQVGSFVKAVGTLTVSDISIDEISEVNFDGTGIYQGDKILTSFQGKLTIDGIYNDGRIFGDGTVDDKDISASVTIKTPLPYADAVGTYGMAVYRVTNSTIGEVVDANTEYALGGNQFVIAEKGIAEGTAYASITEVKSEIFTVDAAYDTVSLTKVDAPKLSYGAGDPLDLSALKVKVKKASQATGTDVAYASFDADNKLQVWVAPKGLTDAAQITTQGTQITGATNVDAAWIGSYAIYVVHPKGAYNTGSGQEEAVAVHMGDIGSKAPASGTISSFNPSFTYGDPLGNGMKFEIVYDDDSTSGVLGYDAFESNDIEMKINGVTVDEDTVITTDMIGKPLEFYIGSTKLASSSVIAVNPKDLKVKSVETTSIKKKYIDNANVAENLMPADMSGLTTADGLINGETADLTKLKVSGITFTYDSPDVHTNKPLKYTAGSLTAAAINSADAAAAEAFNLKYKLVLDENYFDTTAETSKKLTGTIEAQPLALKADVLNAPSVVPGIYAGEDDQSLLKGTKTFIINSTNSTGIIGTETLNLTFEYDYTTVDDLSEIGNPVITVTYKGLADGSGKASNYDFDEALTATKGSITSNKITALEIVNPPATTEYTYPNLRLDLTGMKIKVTYQGSGDAEFSVEEFVKNTGSVTLTDKNLQSATVTASNYNDVCDLAYGDTTISVSTTLGDSVTPATQVVKANRASINVSDIVFEASKVYGTEDATAVTKATIPQTALIGQDVVTVGSADYKFLTETIGTTNTVEISNIVLDGEDSDNYELVGSLPAQFQIGVVTQGDQAAPAAPTLKVDPATNNIIIEAPLGEEIQYSFDGVTWDEITTTTLTELVRDTPYTVYARVKATEDGNYKASPASEPTTITTFKYNVKAILARTTDNVLAEIWTNDISTATKDAEVNTMIFAAAPAKFKAYYSDMEAKTAQTYPLEDADADGNIVLYMTQQSGGGTGGGGSSTKTYTVTFDAGVNGEITRGSNTVKVSSRVSSVPTVTANEGYKFIGWSQDGETVVDPTKVTIKQNTTFTALYEAVEVEPPVVEPPVDDKPVISSRHSKPYAKGYEDGAFRPEGTITRAELAAMIARLSYGDELPDGVYEASFGDIGADAWYNKYIGYLEGLNVMNGYPDGTFKPTQPVTRAEITAVIVRAQKYEMNADGAFFNDIADNWGKDYIATLAGLEIVNGYQDGSFLPQNNLTRAEAVTIINRVLGEAESARDFIPNDIAGHWAEDNIILAVNRREIKDADIAPEEAETTEETDAQEADATEEADAKKEEEADATEAKDETEEETEVPAE